MFGLGLYELWIIMIICVFYFLASVIAYGRRTKRVCGIILLNLFLGWTFIGWVGALVWAVSDNTEAEE